MMALLPTKMPAFAAALLVFSVTAATVQMSAATAADPLLALPAMAQQLAGNCSSTTECTGQCRQVCNVLTLARIFLLAKDPNGLPDAAVAAELYHPKAVLSVTPFALLQGSLAAMEYLTITSMQPAEYPPLANLTALNNLQFIAAGSKFLVVSDLLFTNPFDARYTTALRATNMLSLDSLSRVRYHTIDYPQWAEQFGALNFQETLTQERAEGWARLICDTHEQHCLGKNKQYNSTNECQLFLASIPKLPTAPHRLDDNCLLCRYVHGRIARVDPDVHCPHIGPSGGGMCTGGGVPSYARSKVDKLIPRKAFTSVPAFMQPLLALGGF